MLEKKHQREARPGTWHACAKCGRVRHIAAPAVASASQLRCYGCKRQTSAYAWRTYPQIPAADASRINTLVQQLETQNSLSEELLHNRPQYFQWVEAERKLKQLERELSIEFPSVPVRRRASTDHQDIWSHVHGTVPRGPLPRRAAHQ